MAGESVTLTGTNFAPVLADNEVFVSGTQAVVTAVTDTTLTFTVPDLIVTGSVIVSTPKGATAGRTRYVVATSGLANVSSVAVDSVHTPFVSDTGAAATSDRVYSFDPSTGVRTQRGAINEATGLPTDAATPNRVYYGNALLNAANFGTIRRTDSSGADALYRSCGNSGTGDPCNVFGLAVDPFLTDFGPDGRVYVSDGSAINQKVRLVPPSGTITNFAVGFSFGNSPRGIVADTNSASAFFHDVFVADSANVRRFDSVVPGTLEKTYNSSNSPIISPRQLAISPLPRERLLIADDGRDGVIVINPTTDAAKVVGFPLTDPRAVAVDVDAGGRLFAYVGEPTRVLKLPIPRTVYVAVWVANGSGIGPQRILNQIDRANRTLEPCGIEIKIRDDKINFFDAGALLDVEAYDITGTTGCGDPLFVRSNEEQALLENAARRSPIQTDLNIYFVRSFTLLGGEPAKAAETVTADCFAGMSDAIGSGVIVSARKLDGVNGEFTAETVRALAHEIIHALMDRNSWTPNADEHLTQFGMQLPATNIMRSPGSRQRWAVDTDQCSNINSDQTIFRGDP